MGSRAMLVLALFSGMTGCWLGWTPDARLADDSSDSAVDSDADTDTDADADTDADTDADSDADTDTDTDTPGDADGDGYTVAQGDCDDGEIWVNPGAAETCDSADVDHDCDGLRDEDCDDDGDGLDDATELGLGTDPADADTDNDGMPDGYEHDVGHDPKVVDGHLDPDSDFYDNHTEWQLGTNPNKFTRVLNKLDATDGAAPLHDCNWSSADLNEKVEGNASWTLAGDQSFHGWDQCGMAFEAHQAPTTDQIAAGILRVWVWVPPELIASIVQVGVQLGNEPGNHYDATVPVSQLQSGWNNLEIPTGILVQHGSVDIGSIDWASVVFEYSPSTTGDVSGFRVDVMSIE